MMSLLVDAVEVVVDTVTVPSSTSQIFSIPAPTGKKVTGGGANDPDQLVSVVYSYPEGDGSQWNVRLVNNQLTSQDVDVYAVCVG